MAEGEKIIPINIEVEMKTAYIDYSMSVIVSRALPDVRDGLKPVHRRVLFGMQELGVLSNRPHKKSARIVGEVLGKYHPHGDSSVYDTMVRMAQDWSLRYPLVDGQGNFGSVDGDSPAAMRYTEARLRKIAEELLADIEKETVDFRPNFDDSLEEPTVLPARIPNLLINGSSGIAVGMATNMPPHNLTEVIDGIIAYIDNRDIDIAGLMKFVKAPDFPTGGTIYGYDGVKRAFEEGRGRVVVRGKATIEEERGRNVIIVSEIPYLVNKAEMIRKTAELVEEKKIEGISDIRDESDRTGMRVVYELKRDAIPNVVLNNLYKYTDLQNSFSVLNIALVKGRPLVLNLKEMIVQFVEHRHEVIVRRTKFELRKAEERAHILEGLIIASDNIDEVIALIRASSSPDEAREKLMERFGLSEIQSRAIVEMRLRQLTGLEQDKLRGEYEDVMALIARLKNLLDNEDMRMEVIKEELREIRANYGDERRSQIEYASGDFRIEDMIADEEMVITISHLGYIKRTPLREYRAQSRGGTGSRGSGTRDADFLEHIFMVSNHDYVLIFTEKGKVFWIRAYEIPEGEKTSKGRAIQNLINIDGEDKVRAYINVKDVTDPAYFADKSIILCTKRGVIKKTELEAYSRPRSNGINAITIRENDTLLEARLTNGKDHIMMALNTGRAILFQEDEVRDMGRTASGVRGIRIEDETKEEVVGMVTFGNIDEEEVLVVSEKGYGKRSKVSDYRITGRGGKGVKTLNITDKTGQLVAIKNISDDNDMMIITKGGVTIRINASELRTMGRVTQGVRLINLKNSESIASVAVVNKGDEEEEAAEIAIEGTNPDSPIVNEGENPATDAGTEIENNTPDVE
ncbi:MAG TPA: DNA gyrase subunit A [Flavobacteriales bacterium]|nr:DNA gyrase subunit A [Flavobacteriales bacterium]HRE74260.1 DNA gyrase subunit A [Flavobacteriales bacterium]HRJ39962.1 DNA gyrase subunit A [Flavobacteriales bacterium]